MADILADRFSKQLLHDFSRIVKQAHPGFNSEQFIQLGFDEHWTDKQLKQRLRHISTALGQTLPADYDAAIEILSAISPQCSGFEYLFLPAFGELYGLPRWEPSRHALAHVTSSSGSESAVRPFIEQDPTPTRQQMLEWARRSNHQVRRLASEGCRPKLPWAAPLRT